MGYTLYSPLYMAGPIVTFNAYVHYTVSPDFSSESLGWYAFRWGYCFLLMEWITSAFPFFAIVKSGLLGHLEIAEIAVVLYVLLKTMWIKFLLIWRFFRLWAMTDGILPPENMRRCMSNNSSLSEFWKGWHASFNQWIVRYMYVPLGGRASSMYSAWVVFLFVAVWHDIDPKLLAWGLLNGFFFVIEMLAVKFAKTNVSFNRLPKATISFVCSLSAATYIFVLIAVNMVGYSIGVGGITLVLGKLLSVEGAKVLLVSYYFLFNGVIIMAKLKEEGLSAR